MIYSQKSWFLVAFGVDERSLQTVFNAIDKIDWLRDSLCISNIHPD